MIMQLAEEWLQLERALGFRPGMKGSIHEIRQDLMAQAAAAPKPPSNDKVSIGSTAVKVRTYTPKNANINEGNPVIANFHGGGWCLGDLDADDGLLSWIASDLGIICVGVEYRLAPEHPWPAQLDDCVIGVQWSFRFSRGILVDRAPGLTWLSWAHLPELNSRCRSAQSLPRSKHQFLASLHLLLTPSIKRHFPSVTRGSSSQWLKTRMRRFSRPKCLRTFLTGQGRHLQILVSQCYCQESCQSSRPPMFSLAVPILFATMAFCYRKRFKDSGIYLASEKERERV
ncbi:uncharacterized protein NECHADRAFT_87922 [Fusarium vanettenii 77-13-4]|uniref:Alpha/beta hydrolase fold-3 domain-containing protein n=1 Tax=Fusarium vanettenii (strain ATCC MYA-4622 / CBS 123669 / FGSC 9596 / NRRL 45880 / 77-13-4) TaxID=660122 RepID=C7ZJT0_FUSV7|nr:uncharacterized protein NECHADRAFT_87922 [Fusarium vanettenii 77-13-4]EEU35650.1 predicted protein [Fusarium vanettenii 77-13-4]